MDNQSQESMTQMNSTPIHTGNPYFLGNEAIITFSGGEDGYGPKVYWLVDKDNRTVRPFESEIALQKVFGDGYQDALSHCVTIVPAQINQDGEIMDGVLRGFNILDPNYAIKEDGTSQKLDFSPHQLKGRYGKAVDQNAEGLSTEVLDGLLNHLKSKEGQTGITGTFINKIKQDQHLMAFYISALAYGNYTISDVYKDISQRFKREGNK